MNDTDLLGHDHGFLSSQVKHVTALFNAVLAGSLTPTALDGEIRRKTKLLSEEIVAHFQFEEDGAFPYLSKLVPGHRSALELQQRSHSLILDALDETLVALDSIIAGDLAPNLPRVLEKYERFHVAFLMHVQEESDLLREIAQLLSPDQREAVNAQFSGP